MSLKRFYPGGRGSAGLWRNTAPAHNRAAYRHKSPCRYAGGSLSPVSDRVKARQRLGHASVLADVRCHLASWLLVALLFPFDLVAVLALQWLCTAASVATEPRR